jgi:serine/threonine protein kinase
MPIDPRQVQAAFLEAAQAAAADRSAILDQVCGENIELRRRVELLLGAHDDSADLPPAAGGAEGTDIFKMVGAAAAPSAKFKPGDIIAGRYKLLEAIGEGGMGTVWLAEQTQPIRRKVALKLIKAGMDSKSVLARFEAERQALAVMDHPNIAKVLDGGLTETGRPFFVMEYVKGVPITEYCESARLSIPQRLELFVQVCQAVQHAHQKGIIHRDLKPSNILVAPYDGRPVPKVIDFGLAKAMHESLTELTLHTFHETVLGTPLYMSPEQAQLNNIDVDTRSDLYSLGVLLYELLTGTTPLEKRRLKEAAWDEIRRIIREEEPPRPSMRLSSSDALPSLAAGRQMEPARLTKLVRGELDWIVMKSLEKDRTRRYETANGFAADIQRYLAGEPIMAAPPSASYRLRKFAHRNRAVLGTAIVVTLALVSGTGVALWQASKASRSAETAKRNESDALKAKADLENANDELQRRRDETEITLARSLLRPFALQPGPLSEQEVDSLWELGGNRGERLWERFVKQALGNPMTTRQLKTRAEPALIAAVGLDPAKRLQVERLLGERLRDRKLADGQRADLALIAVSLKGLTPAAQAEVAETLTETLGKVTDPSAWPELADGISTLVTRMEPKEAARVCSCAAATLSQAQAKTKPAAFEPFARGLSSLAAHMDPEEAALICSQAATTITRALEDKSYASYTWEPGTEALYVLAPYIKREQATQAAAVISGRVGLQYSSRGRGLPEVLAVLAARIAPDEAARACSHAAKELIHEMQEQRVGFRLPAQYYAGGLISLAPYLKPADAAEAATVIAREITKEYHEDRFSLPSALKALAPRLDPKDVAKVADILTKQLSDLSKARNWNAIEFLLFGLTSLAPYMPPEEAARLFAPRSYYPMVSASSFSIEHFSASSIRMKPEDAASTLIKAMGEAEHPNELCCFAETLSRVVARMEPKEASRVCAKAATILNSMERKFGPTYGSYCLRQHTVGFLAIAPYLPDKEANQFYSQEIDSTLKVLTGATDVREFNTLAHMNTDGPYFGPWLLASRMEPKQRAQVAAIIDTALLQAQKELRGKNKEELIFLCSKAGVLAEVLSDVAVTLDPDYAEHVNSHAADFLTEFAGLCPSRVFVPLSYVAARMEPKEASRVCAKAAGIILQNMEANRPNVDPSWAMDIGVLCAYMLPSDAARVRFRAASILTEALARSPANQTPGNNAKILLPLLTRMDMPTVARQVAAQIRGYARGGAIPGYDCNSWPIRESRSLSTQDLVELLKQPTCIGHARRLIVDQLENQYHSPFPDHWAFVRYAQERQLGLDFITAPTRIGYGIAGHGG